MSVQAPTKAPKITYSAVGGNMDEIHASYDAALAAVRGKLGATHRLFIDGAFVEGDGPLQQTASPIDREVIIGKFTSASA
ncbi:MAG: hypothetical protein GIW99_11690, partial [Candidatus Eremiobacteraeota bacterium]|nr:hypothetical protein [Candidatus Eremiobacteraeota bacterium]